MTEKLVESRLPRSFFGKIIKWIFVLFNLFMLLWLVGGMNSASDNMSGMTNEWEQAGAAIGTSIGAFMIMGIWVFGVIVLTPVLFLTRGKKVLEKIEG